MGELALDPRMNYVARPIEDGDYEMICSWWEAHQWPVMPRCALPPIGLMVWQHDTPIIAGFLYKAEGCVLGWVEFIVANPETTHEERTPAFTVLVDCLLDAAQKAGAYCIYTTALNESLMERLQDYGFAKTDEGVTHFVKIVSPEEN